EPVRRYEREQPGELIHIDIKKLGKIDGIGHRITGDRRGQSNRRARGEGLGWEFVHVCIDDASRIAFSRVLKDEKKASATAFLKEGCGAGLLLIFQDATEGDARGVIDADMDELPAQAFAPEIGRASCRERASISVSDGSV